MLRNRKDTEEPKLVGVNRVADPTKLKLGTFYELQNFIQAKRYKIKKKRGPEPLVSCTLEPPPPEPGECTDATERGQQPVSILEHFINNANDLGGNTRTSWGYISPDEEVYTLVGNAFCGGGNMNYNDTCCQVNHFTTPAVLTHPPLIDPDGSRPAGNPRMITADQPAYGFGSNAIGGAGFAIYYPLLNTHVDYLMPSVGGWDGFNTDNFAVRGDNVFITAVNETVFNHNSYILKYDRATGGSTPLQITTLTGFWQRNAVLTEDFLYVLCQNKLNSNDYSVKKLNVSDGSLAGTFQIDNIAPYVMGAVNDDLIYLLCSSVNGTLYYIKNFTDLIFVGTSHNASSIGSPFGANGFFSGSAFYTGGTGHAGFNPNIFKIVVECPEEGPLIATVSRGATEVAAGADITATWADILEPEITDAIQLRPAPTGGSVGFVGSALASQVTDGTAAGSMPFTIPGGTTPGEYVFMYTVQSEQVYVATSPPFTVTA